MSLALTLPPGRSFSLPRPIRRHAALNLPSILIKSGGLLAVAGLLSGIMLCKMGLLTLFWIKLLPIPTCGGGALLCLGVLILCIRDLRAPSDAMNFPHPNREFRVIR